MRWRGDKINNVSSAVFAYEGNDDTEKDVRREARRHSSSLSQCAKRKRERESESITLLYYIHVSIT